jgi:aminoglycoside phosphotransferase
MQFNALSQKLAIPLHRFQDILAGELDINAINDCGIIIDSSLFTGLFSRIQYVLFRKTTILKKIKRLENLGLSSSAILAVYPDAESPLIVYNQKNKAEAYCCENILPKLDWSIKGILKRILYVTGQVHPSVNSFILIVGKSNQFQAMNQLLKRAHFTSQQDLLCITTSNPVFLSFSNQSAPDYVIHRSEEGELELKQEIHHYLGSLVSEPLVEDYISGQNYLIEKGLHGKPWFQILIDKRFSALEIKERSLKALAEMKNSIKNNESWHVKVDVVKEFKSQFEKSHANRQFDQVVVKSCEKIVRSFASSYTVDSTWQHGDFCINNIIFSHENTYLIDFEEFGDTHMPLQDEISLALSFYIQREVHDLDLLAEDLEYCLKSAEADLIELMPLFFAYHMLFRLGAWGNNPNRAFICGWMQKLFFTFLSEPERVFSKLNKKIKMGN